MSALDPRWTRWLLWFAPFAALALAIGLQTGWGRELRRVPPVEAPVLPAPVVTAVMPEYGIAGGLDAMKTTVERPLFNATRRPAPSAVAEAPKPVIQRGQFVLTGTMITDKAAIAFLKEASGTGKARSVKKGDSVNGMMVTEVAPDRVRFTLGDETEDLELKVAKGPKATVQPTLAAAPPAAPQPGAQPAKGAPVAAAAGSGRGGRAVPGAVPAAGQDAGENLRASRRAARAAEGQRQGAQAQPDQNASTPPRPQPNTWAETYQRMQRGGK